MNRKIKLIWDFRGPEALEIAKHHCVHLKEFAKIEDLDCYDVNHTELNEMLTIAYIIVDEKNMKIFRDALRPHRGELAE